MGRKTKPDKMWAFGIRIDDALRDKLNREAKKCKRKPSTLAREIIELHYLNKSTER